VSHTSIYQRAADPLSEREALLSDIYHYKGDLARLSTKMRIGANEVLYRIQEEQLMSHLTKARERSQMDSRPLPQTMNVGWFYSEEALE
jgi:hypothetical protein